MLATKSLRHLIILFLTFHQIAIGQSSMTGPGEALNLQGNQQVNLSNVINDIQLPITIEAWIYIDDLSEPYFPIFHAQNEDNGPGFTYYGFWLWVFPDRNNLIVAYGDGTQGIVPQHRRSAVGTYEFPEKQWIHVAGTMRSATNMSLYVDGIPIQFRYNGSGGPMVLSNNQRPSIGNWFTNNTDTYNHGQIDEVRVWSTARTEAQIQENMCRKLVGNEAGLYGYWTMDGGGSNAIIDQTNRGNHGSLVNGANKVRSGAAIGDNSWASYSNSVASHTLEHTSEEITFEASNNDSRGLQLYQTFFREGDRPDQGCAADFYWGVYTPLHPDGDTTYQLKSTPSTNYENRYFAATSNWRDTTTLIDSLPFEVALRRGDWLPQNNESINIEALTSSACEGTPVILRANTNADNVIWNTGETTKEISITESGVYQVTASGNCGTSTESFTVEFDTPPNVSISILGDLDSCSSTSVQLQAFSSEPQLNWNTGDTSSIIDVTQSGIYQVVVENQCGRAEDEIEVQLASPIALTLRAEYRGDCALPYVEVLAIFSGNNSSLQWDDGSNSSIIEVNESVTLGATLSNVCGTVREEIEVFIPAYDPDLFPNIITPNGDGFNDFLILHPSIEGMGLKVFNRWGKMVYEESLYNNMWDGTGLADGVYYVLIEDYCSGRDIKYPLHLYR